MELAKTKWLRVAANMSAGNYEAFEAVAQLGEPQWPDMPFSEVLKIAFKDFMIDSLDHPVLKQLRGEI